MSSGFTHSLKFQVSVALLSIVVVFTAAVIYTSSALKRQHNIAVVINLAGKLQLTAEHLANQGINYKKNAPTDYTTYRRDIRLYYHDLMSHVATFDQISSAFMRREFSPEITGLKETLHPNLGENARRAIDRVEQAWTQYREKLFDALGPSRDSPRLEYAAGFVIANHHTLEQVTSELASHLQRWAESETRNINLFNRLALVAALLISGIIIAGFYRNVLNPLSRAAAGFGRITQGDFGHQVPLEGSNEITELTTSFNRLSRRLKSLFLLIERIQQGGDLHETLAFVSDEFKDLLRIDWTGVVFITGDGGAARLEVSYLDGEQEITVRKLYRLKDTYIEQTLQQNSMLHIPNMLKSVEGDTPYEFLRMLVDKGMRDALFLPLSPQSPLPGVLVFATHQPNTYTGEHLKLLTNIAHLIIHSFGRTARLTESARLAAIGEFTSGIVHEIRNPLATISIALDYFSKLDLPGSGHQRAELARKEAERMERLLEDILLYSKPLNLNFQLLEMGELLHGFLDEHNHIAKEKNQHFTLKTPEQLTRVMGDRDRLTQVFLNLARNACEAAPAESPIQWRIDDHPKEGTLIVEVKNRGAPIPDDVLPRITEPFFTTKVAGTGLGLSIVKRIVEAHGGELRITSAPKPGTRIQIVLPRVGH